ncbi:MAG: efflux RND transporter periplasmic adaptor subunit, partial [Pseudomonadota bacterium]|nr:efflux RND transporter periplasmic adaptor subunit [Pseudomonadota bacterium]
MKNDLPIEQAGRTRKSLKRWLIPLVVVLLVGAGGAVVAMRGGNKKVEAPKAAAAPAVMELANSDVVSVDARELRVQLPVSGGLTALHQATVKSKVIGEVRETPVPEGVAVRRGEVVVRLDAADLQARVGAQQAAVEDARARLALAVKNHDNNNALLKQKFISQNAVDTAENSVELARAAVKSANAQLDIARRAMEDAVVRSPIDGIVSKRFVQPGEKAAPDMPLFAVVDLTQLILEAQVPASEIPRVAVGQAVGFTVD